MSGYEALSKRLYSALEHNSVKIILALSLLFFDNMISLLSSVVQVFS